MSNYISIQSSNEVIEHFGTKGMRWGHRKSKEFYTKKYINKGYHPRHAREMAQKRMVLNKRLKTGAKIVGGVALAGLAAYGAYKGYNHLKGNWDRVAADHLAVKNRNEAIRKEFDRMRNKNTDRDLDALHKRGESVKDLFRKRAEEINNLNKGWAGSSSSKKAAADTIRNRHEYAGKEMKRAFENITKSDSARDARIDKQFNQIDDLLRDLSGGGATRRGANGRRIKDVTNSLRG